MLVLHDIAGEEHSHGDGSPAVGEEHGSSPGSSHGHEKEEAKMEEALPVKEHSSKGLEEQHAPHGQDSPAEDGHAGK
jgi:hypothetical protein